MLIIFKIKFKNYKALFQMNFERHINQCFKTCNVQNRFLYYITKVYNR